MTPARILIVLFLCGIGLGTIGNAAIARGIPG